MIGADTGADIEDIDTYNHWLMLAPRF